MYSKADCIEEIKRISLLISSQLNNLIKSIQWYCTFVLATIGGLIKLLLISHGVAYGFFFAALIFAIIAIGLLIWNAVEAQSLIFEQETNFASAQSLIDEEFDKQSEAEQKKFRSKLQKQLDVVEESGLEWMSKFGLCAFGLSIILGGIGVLILSA